MRYVPLLILLASCGTVPFQEKRLATIPEGTEIRLPAAFSRDGTEVAYMAKSGEDYFAVRGTWKSSRLDFI